MMGGQVDGKRARGRVGAHLEALHAVTLLSKACEAVVSGLCVGVIVGRTTHGNAHALVGALAVKARGQVVDAAAGKRAHG